NVSRHKEGIAASLDSETYSRDFAQRYKPFAESAHDLEVDVRSPDIASPFAGPVGLCLGTKHPWSNRSLRCINFLLRGFLFLVLSGAFDYLGTPENFSRADTFYPKVSLGFNDDAHVL